MPGTNQGKPDQKLGRRRAVLLGTGAVALLLALAYVHFFLWRPVGSGPAGPPVALDAFEQVWSEDRVLLLGLGDSITRGFGADVGHGYVDRLAKNPADEFPGMTGRCLSAALLNLTVQNLSVNGSTSLDHAEKQTQEQPAGTRGIVVMTTGGNDVIHMYGRIPPREGAMYGATMAQAEPWIANFDARLDTMMAQIRGAFPGGCQVFLANIYDPSDGDGDPTAAQLPPWPDVLEILGAYNDRLERCAARYDFVHLVDIHGTFLGHGVTCRRFWHPHYDAGDPHYWYYVNLEDPNDRGYDAIRRVFLNAMIEVLPAWFGAAPSAKETREAPAG